MFDLGDTVMLAVNTFDSTGALADPSTPPTLRVTRPDGTTPGAPLSPVHPSVGTFTYAWTDTANAGLYEVYWDSPSSLISAYADSFLVVGADRMLIGLDEAKRAIGADRYAASNTSDEDLRGVIAGVGPVMEDICGPIFRTPFDEWHDGGAPLIVTLRQPIISLTTVSESYGAGYVRTLTNQPLDGISSYDAFGYTADLKHGTIYRRTSGAAVPFAYGSNNVRVTGLYGRAVLPPNIARATRRLVKYLWQTELQGQRPQGSKPDMVGTESGFLVPRAVIAWCGDEARTIGIG